MEDHESDHVIDARAVGCGGGGHFIHEMIITAGAAGNINHAGSAAEGVLQDPALARLVVGETALPLDGVTGAKLFGFFARNFRCHLMTGGKYGFASRCEVARFGA